MPSNEFFDEQTSATRVKTDIVVDYFKKWSSIMMNHLTKPEQLRRNPNPRIAYLDLFSGSGTFDDGKKSTPILILEYAIQDERLPSRLITIFNDKEKPYIEKLKTTAENLQNYNALKYAPIFQNEEVDELMADGLDKMSLVPSLLFVDPFGYKGLSLRLVKAITHNWGCDCIFYFNYHSLIIRNINNEGSYNHLVNLFGSQDVVDDLINSIDMIQNDKEKEDYVLDVLKRSVINQNVGNYFLKFRFESDKIKNVARYLVFVTKHKSGFVGMKEIMSKFSIKTEKGIPLYRYYKSSETSLEFLFDDFDDTEFVKLKSMIIDRFGSQNPVSISDIVKYIVEPEDSIYIEKNVKDALKDFEIEGRLKFIDEDKRRKGSFSNNQLVILEQRYHHER